MDAPTGPPAHPARWGAALALCSLPVHLLLPIAASRQMAALFLALIAGVYVGFSVADGRERALATESAVALGFLGAALVGQWVSAWAIPAVYLLHGLWDLAHHSRVGAATPRWYIPFCAMYDWVFAGGLIAIWLR